MSTHATCPQGHRWEISPAEAPAAATQTVCPVCGAAALAADSPTLTDDQRAGARTDADPPLPVAQVTLTAAEFVPAYPSGTRPALLPASLAQAGFPPLTASGTLSLPAILLLTLLDSCALIACIVGLLVVHGENPVRVLLGPGRRWRDVLLGVWLLPAAFVIAFGTLIAIRALLPWLHNLETNPLEALIATRRDAWMFLVVAVVHVRRQSEPPVSPAFFA